MTTGDLADWLDASADPVLFVIGSAISYASPAGAPSAHEIVSASARGLADMADPTGALRALPFVESPPWQLLPESLYAAVDQIHGRGIHGRVWGTLAVDRSMPGHPRPNAGHYLVAVAAARTNGTVLTTNFDPFLEQALGDLGIPHDTLTGLDVWNGRRPAAGRVLVLKVHGDAGTPESLVSKAPDLARARRVLEKVAFDRPFGRALVVGYSGRDFDVFPWLVARSGVSEVCWVDRAFATGHRSNLVSSCLQLTADADPLARGELSTWAAAGDGNAQRALDILRSAIAPTHDITGAAVAAVHQALGELRSDAGAARWALARAFADIGRHPWAEQIVTSPGPPATPAVEAELSLLASFLSASQDRYRDSVQEAERAVAIARAVPDRRFRRSMVARGRLQARFARTLYETVSLPFDRGLVPSPGKLSTLRGRVTGLAHVTLLLLAAVRHAPAGLASLRAAARAGFGTTAPEYRLACDYLETLIRLQAFVVRLFPPLRALQSRVLLRLDRTAHDIGYLTGAINISKYLRRTPYGGTHGAAVTLGRLLVLDDAVPKAIEARDLAGRIADAAPLSDADRVALDEATTACMEAAAVAGAASLELQAVVLRRRHGLKTAGDRVEALVDGVQVRSIEVQAGALKRALT